MSKKFLFIVIALLVIIALLVTLIIVLSKRNDETNVVPVPIPTVTTTTTPTRPLSPTGVQAEALSMNKVSLKWVDNSNDEEGFIITRNYEKIAMTGPNTSQYNDSGLSASTTYTYSVRASNDTGESSAASCEIKTLNPPISIRLDKVGVFDNREPILRGETGEVYLYAIVSDGKNTIVNKRFPIAEGTYYKLEKESHIDVNIPVFSAEDVGDKLTLTIIGYENDGEGFEDVVYQAIEVAVKMQAGGAVGTILEAFDVSLGDLIGKFFGDADDSLGSYENTWEISSGWGAGQYADIVCKDENNIDCLRLWFTISSP
jgi:hypothetical protein